MGSAIGKLIEAIGRAYRGPVPQPRPLPTPNPVRPKPAPTPPPQRKPPTPEPRRPVPPNEGGTDPEPQPEPQPETLPETEGQTETETATKTDDDQECETCPDCVAREMGALIPNHYGSVGEAAQRGYAYQHFVCPWHAHVPSANLIEEWTFSGIDFDGLHPAECLLYEAKHGYDDFLVQDDWSASGRPRINPKKPWAREIFDDIVDKADKRWTVCAPHYPDVRLRYVFSSLMTQIYVVDRFHEERLFLIEFEHRPWRKEDG